MSSSSDDIDNDDEFIDFAGDILDKKYFMIKLIGEGGFAFVWMAYDVIGKKYVAIKVQNSSCYTDAKDEVKIMRRIREKDTKYLNTILDNFKYVYDGDKYMCMVFQLFACSLYDLVKQMGPLSIKNTKKVTIQILKGLDILHNELHITHTDVKPENILLKGVNTEMKNIIDQIDFDSVYEKNVEMYKKKHNLESYKFLKKKKGMLLEKTAKHIMDVIDFDKKADIFIDPEYIEKCEINISDFGNCYFDDETDDDIQTRYYRAPEIIIGSKYDNRVDIWSLGCTIYELLTGKLLFNPDKNELSRDTHHLCLIQQLIGPMPKKIIKRSKRGKYFFNRHGSLIDYKKKETIKTLDNILDDIEYDEEIYNIIKNTVSYNRCDTVSCLKQIKFPGL